MIYLTVGVNMYFSNTETILENKYHMSIVLANPTDLADLEIVSEK